MAVDPLSVRRFVSRTLVAATGLPAPDRAAVVGAYGRLCGALQSRLSILFGADAVHVLHARALQLSTAEYPWVIDVLPTGAGAAGMFARLDGRVRDAEVVAGLAAVLARELGLLTALIGEDVVMQLVQEAWSAPPENGE